MPRFRQNTSDRGKPKETADAGSQSQPAQRSNAGQAALAQRVRRERAARALAASADQSAAKEKAPTEAEAPHPYFEAGKQLLELVGEQLENTPRTESLRPKRAAPWEDYDVPVDDGILQAESPAHELTIRMLATGLAERGLVLPRFDLEQLYYLVPWNALPSQQEVVDEVAAALGAGRPTIWYRSNAVGLALQANEQRTIKLNRAYAELQEQLKNSTYVEDAIASFYIAHINAPIGLINDGVSLAWKGTNALGVTGDSPPQLGQIEYVGEFGQKYGTSMEAGAKAALLFIATGPLAGVLAQGSSRAAAAVGSIGFGGGRVGVLALQAARLSMTVGVAVDVAELAALVTALLVSAATGSDEERAMALEALWEIAVYGAFEYVLSRGAKTAAKTGARGKSEAAGGGPDSKPAATPKAEPQKRKGADSEQKTPETERADTATKDRDGRGAAERGGFARGISASEISSINKSFGGTTAMTGSPSSIAANAARYPGFFEKSASMIRDIAGRHMFDNGNKRTAVEVVNRLMKRNSIMNGPTAQELQRVVGQVARGELRTVAEIASALRGYK